MSGSRRAWPVLLLAALAGQADAEPARRRDASWPEIFAGPFTSTRLFAMPVADIIGAYQLSLSGDGSLLQEPGVLSAAGVLAIGFGDIAQLEYRHTAAISVERSTAPVPAIGVQLKAPLPERPYLPAVALAFRLGVPRRETFGATAVDETVTDLYLVARLRLGGPGAPVTLHGGARLSSATIGLGGDRSGEAKALLVLPAGGVEVTANAQTQVIGELGRVPVFSYDAGAPAPSVGTGWLGRLGVRWRLHPAFSIDASLGYRFEVARVGAGPRGDGAGAVVDWDIRLGGELFVPWGAIACRSAGIFCE